MLNYFWYWTLASTLCVIKYTELMITVNYFQSKLRSFLLKKKVFFMKFNIAGFKIKLWNASMWPDLDIWKNFMNRIIFIEDTSQAVYGGVGN